MYKYEEQKAWLFTDEGQRTLIKVLDLVQALLSRSRAFKMSAIYQVPGGGDTWNLHACVDRLVELGRIREVPIADVCGQDRIFVSPFGD